MQRHQVGAHVQNRPTGRAADHVLVTCVYLQPPLHAGVRQLAAVAPSQVEAAAAANAAWLEDVVMHLLCVLALDRFADYVSDQVGLRVGWWEIISGRFRLMQTGLVVEVV